MTDAAVDIDDLATTWKDAWPDAMAQWSPYVRLRSPMLCGTTEQEQKEGLTGSFAMLRLRDTTVVISLQQVHDLKLDDLPLEVLGHEVGHHVLCPADLADQARMLARMRRALPSVEDAAPFVANLYADLLINDRLQRSAGRRMDEVYRRIGADPGAAAPSPLWSLYLRTYELLWSLPKGTLVKGEISNRIEGDASLASRLVRVYARRWLDGAGGFAALLFPHLVDEQDPQAQLGQLRRLVCAGIDSAGMPIPAGLTEMDDGPIVHPAFDPLVGGKPSTTDPPAPADGVPMQSAGQSRPPFEYGQLLRALGMDLDDHEVAVRWYRERALPHLIPFPTRKVRQSTDPLPEGVEEWDVGSPLADIDWIESVLVSPKVIPGATTVQRVWGEAGGDMPKTEPIDLDLYVDSSGSMPNPQTDQSFLALAGAIVALSALRAGARVQCTLWSGPGEFEVTPGFVTDEQQILRVLTGSIQGSTAFPLHIFRDTYANRSPEARPAHVLVISDEGVTTMFENADEKGTPGWDVCRSALAKAGGGGTLVLNLYAEIDQIESLVRARDQEGWNVHRVSDWQQLVDFARAFSRRTYEEVA